MVLCQKAYEMEQDAESNINLIIMCRWNRRTSTQQHPTYVTDKQEYHCKWKLGFFTGIVAIYDEENDNIYALWFFLSNTSSVNTAIYIYIYINAYQFYTLHMGSESNKPLHVECIFAIDRVFCSHNTHVIDHLSRNKIQPKTTQH